MAQLTIDVSSPAHRQFKAQCAHRGVTMADVMRAAIAAFVQEGNIDFYARADAEGIMGWLREYGRMASEEGE